MANSDWTNLEVEGLEEFEQRLGELTNKVAGNALYGALNYAMTPMLKEAKARAPATEAAYKRYMASGQGESTFVTTKFGKKRRGKSKRAKRGEGKFEIQQPGTLRRSIKRQQIRKKPEYKEGAAVGLFVQNSKKDMKPYYWYFIEYGTAKMPATPFFRPAFDNNVEAALLRFSETLNENIDNLSEQ